MGAVIMVVLFSVAAFFISVYVVRAIFGINKMLNLLMDISAKLGPEKRKEVVSEIQPLLK